MWWCRQEERQNENAHFWRDLSLAVWGSHSLSTFFSKCIQYGQSAHDELMSQCEVSWPWREPHTWNWLDHPLTTLTLTKVYLQVGPSSYKRWFGLLCARLWEELISSFMPFLIYFRLWAKALLKISLPHLLLLEVTYPLWKILEVMCVLHTHTHTQKSKSSIPWNHRELSLALSSLFK